MEFTTIGIRGHVFGSQWCAAVASNVDSVVAVVFGVGEVEPFVELGCEWVEDLVGWWSVSIEFFVVYVQL